MRKFYPIDIKTTVTTEAVEHIYQGIKDSTLPKAEWTHGGHLCGAVGILVEIGLVEAERIMPDIIRRYNVACGITNSDTEGYHHTLTLFYLRVIARELEQINTNSLGDKATSILKSEISARDYPLRYYEKTRLFSKEARLNWIEPDRRPLG